MNKETQQLLDEQTENEVNEILAESNFEEMARQKDKMVENEIDQIINNQIK